MTKIKKRTTFYHHMVETEFGRVFIVTDHFLNDEEEQRALVELALNVASRRNLNTEGEKENGYRII